VIESFPNGQVVDEWYELENVKAEATLEQHIRFSMFQRDQRQAGRLNLAEREYVHLPPSRQTHFIIQIGLVEGN